MSRNTIRRFANHDGQFYFVICTAIRVSDHDWVRRADKGTGCFKKEADPLNLSDLVLMVYFGILACLFQMFLVVDRRSDHLPGVGNGTRQRHVFIRDA